MPRFSKVAIFVPTDIQNDCFTLHACARGKNMDIEHSINLKEKTLAIGHEFTKFANAFSHQHFPLYDIYKRWRIYHGGRQGVPVVMYAIGYIPIMPFYSFTCIQNQAIICQMATQIMVAEFTLSIEFLYNFYWVHRGIIYTSAQILKKHQQVYKIYYHINIYIFGVTIHTQTITYITCIHIHIYIHAYIHTYINTYHIAQNSGGGKLWRIW